MTTYAPHSQQPSGPRPRRGVWLLVAAVAVVALILGAVLGWLVARPSASPASVSSPGPTAAGQGGLGAPHGPKQIQNGVPSGYQKDKPGAATAAINAIQLQTAVAHGRADSATAANTWIASTADAHARTALSAGPSTPGDDQTSKTPLTTRVTTFSETAATVEVWIVSIGSSTGIGGGTVTSENWQTQTYTLVWEKNDWKVVSFRTKTGPKPGDSESRTGSVVPPLTNGLYTVYID